MSAKRVAPLVLLVAGVVVAPASAGTKGPPYDAVYSRRDVQADATTIGRASATTTPKHDGTISIATEADGRLPAGVDVYAPDGRAGGVGSSSATASAGVRQTVSIVAAGPVTVTITQIAASMSASAGPWPSGAFSHAIAEATFSFFPCAVGVSCIGEDQHGASAAVASTQTPGPVPSTLTFTYTPPKTGRVEIAVGFRASSYATGTAETVASVSGTVSTISIPGP